MPDLPMPPGAAEVQCDDCGEGLLVRSEKADATRLVHNGDGSHMVITAAQSQDRPR